MYNRNDNYIKLECYKASIILSLKVKLLLNEFRKNEWIKLHDEFKCCFDPEYVFIGMQRFGINYYQEV